MVIRSVPSVRSWHKLQVVQALVAIAACALLAAIASVTVAAAPSNRLAGIPPTPACDGTDCFKVAPPEPGTAIPTSTVKLGIRPFTDNAFYMIAATKGWFKDVGISISPAPFGVKETSTNAIPLVLRHSVDVSALCGCEVTPTLATQHVLKMIMLVDNGVSFTIFANPKLKLKTFDYYIGQGASLAQALHKTLAPIAKANTTLPTTPGNAGGVFLDTAFGLAGFKVPKLQILDDSHIIELARAGRFQFILPTSAPHTEEALAEGWTPLLNVGDVVAHAKTAAEIKQVRPLAISVGLVANKSFALAQPNTVLRLVSAVLRTLDQIKANPSLMQIYQPFNNSFTGTNLTAKQLYQVLNKLDPISPWATGQKTYFEQTSSPYYYKSFYSADAQALVKAGTLPKANYVPDDFIWAGQVYQTLKWYQDETNKLLAAIKNPTGAKKQLVARARTYYAWHDYLDSYRLAKAAS